MNFALAPHRRRGRAPSQEVSFSITSAGGGLTGRLVLPRAVLQRLGWTPGLPLEVLTGTTGWFALRPSLVTPRARLRVKRTGAGVFTSWALAPDAKRRSPMTPETQLDGQTLYLKV